MLALDARDLLSFSMATNTHDIDVLRELAKQYSEIAARPVQEERRKLWSAHFSLKPTRAPVLVTYGMWNVWCQEVFPDSAMECENPFYRNHERWLRMQIFHDAIGDDCIFEPWIAASVAYATPGGIYGDAWGVSATRATSDTHGGSWKASPPIQEWEDMANLQPPAHAIDEEATRRNVERLTDAVGDILAIDVSRGPILSGFGGDISTTLAAVRGLEQIMIDMYESPEQLHALLAFLRDGVLANQQQAEDAGDISVNCGQNQAMPYEDTLPRREPNTSSRKRGELWGFFAAQEYTLISPDFHDEFLLQYQLPIIQNYAMIHYGCCEDLTHKIDMLRKIPNLRSIAVTPVANVARCAEQIGKDYVISWRPNPTDMVCAGWDENRIRTQLTNGLAASRDGFPHIHLKDVETVQGDTDRLRRWTQIAREVVEAEAV